MKTIKILTILSLHAVVAWLLVKSTWIVGAWAITMFEARKLTAVVPAIVFLCFCAGIGLVVAGAVMTPRWVANGKFLDL